tara:strand:+ start:2635 stop:2898 length:264 start_codon:yes stop_codon:yes gene_type:complete
VYVIELALKLSPFPLSVQRKDLAEAKILYQKVKDCMSKQHPDLLELSCEKVEDKKISILVSELSAVQIYEKTASSVGAKRPGFNIES